MSNAKREADLIRESGLFDPNWYLSEYPDVAATGLEPLEHYMRYGALLQRHPGPKFDIHYYLASNTDVASAGVNPLLHYILNGVMEGREALPLPIAPSDYHDRVDSAVPISNQRFGKTCSNSVRLKNGDFGAGGSVALSPEPSFGFHGYTFDLKKTGSCLILPYKSNGAAKRVTCPNIGIHLHLHYPDLADEFCHFLANIPFRFSLYISVTDRNALDRAFDIFHTRLPRASVQVKLFENRGRDLVPFLSGFGSELASHDLIAHIHTKRSHHNKTKADWRRQLLVNLFGSESIVQRIVELFEENPRIGMVFPEYHYSLRNQISWGADFPVCEKLAGRIGIEIAESVLKIYPAGTMFWTRSSSLKKLFSAGITYDDFPQEAGQVDAASAQAIERLFGEIVHDAGFDLIQVKSDKPHNLICYFPKKWPYEQNYTADGLNALIAKYRADKASRKTPARVVVYTALAGGYHKPVPHEHLNPDYDYVLFTDAPITDYGLWDVRPMDYWHSDPVRMARYVKTHPHKYLSDYDFAIWVDANVIIRGSISKYVDILRETRLYPIGGIPHPLRDCIYAEAAAVLEGGRDKSGRVERQVQAYKDGGYPKNNGLIETNFLIVDLAQGESQLIMDQWWAQIERYSHRDQLSLNYVLWKNAVGWTPIMNDGISLRDNFDFAYLGHGLDSGYIPYENAERHCRVCDSNQLVVSQPSALTRVNADNISIDIILPVFNALADVGQCLLSVLEHTSDPYRIIVVNDASEPETTHWLRWFTSRHPGRVTLLENEVNQGYTRAINRGIQSSQGDYIILLNSDTVVTPGWLDRLAACASSSPRIGIVGPLSNAASWQNVPELLATDGSFAVNELPNGWTFADMADAVSRCAPQPTYPRVPFINGFCYLIKREVIKTIGLFDEVAFPRGYGEENDYSLRCADAGFELAIAEDCYVFHAKSRSFGHEQRKELSLMGKQAFEAKHDRGRIKELIAQLKNNVILHRIRQQILDAQSRTIACGMVPVHDQKALPRILFLLPVNGGGGGAHSVVQEASAMRSMGIDAAVVIKKQCLERFRSDYSRLPSVDGLFLPFEESTLLDVARKASVVVATIFTSVRLLAKIKATYPNILAAYYVQDYEPLFFTEDRPQHHEALASYDLIPGLVRFAKTRWICDEVSRLHGEVMYRVIPSIDHDVYLPSADKPLIGRHVVVAMIRPQTPRRGAARTMHVLKALAERYGKRVCVETFGCSDENIAAHGLDHDFEFVNHGELRQHEVARVLAGADIFLDLSDYQAFGRTAAEAMACGCVPIVTRAGGACEFMEDGRNGYLVDVNDTARILARVDAIINDRASLHMMRESALNTAARYSKVSAALSELTLFQESRRAISLEPVSAQLVLLPIRQNDGTPTASAYVRVVLPYQHPRIATRYAVMVASALPDSPPAVLVVQRSALYKAAGDPIQSLREWQGRGTRIVLDLDDDLLDPEPLRARMPKYDVDELTSHVRTLASMADAVFVTTETLAKRLRAVCGDRVRIIPNGLDEKIWLLDGKHVQRDDSVVKIGYIGSYSHDGDLAMIQGAIVRIRREYGSRVQFELIGGSKTDDGKLWKRINPLPKHREYPHFVKWLRERVDWHIGLAPLTSEVFNSCKSPLKYFDYSALGLATICSDRPPYQGVVNPRNTGLLVPDSEDAWYGAIKELIEDAELRRQLSEAAYADVVANDSLHQVSRNLLTALEDVLNSANAPAGLQNTASIQVSRAGHPDKNTSVEPAAKRSSAHVHTDLL